MNNKYRILTSGGVVRFSFGELRTDQEIHYPNQEIHYPDQEIHYITTSDDIVAQLNKAKNKDIIIILGNLENNHIDTVIKAIKDFGIKNIKLLEMEGHDECQQLVCDKIPTNFKGEKINNIRFLSYSVANKEFYVPERQEKHELLLEKAIKLINSVEIDNMEIEYAEGEIKDFSNLENALKSISCKVQKVTMIDGGGFSRLSEQVVFEKVFNDAIKYRNSIIRNAQDRSLAFAMAGHSRLRKESAVPDMPEQLLQEIHNKMLLDPRLMTESLPEEVKLCLEKLVASDEPRPLSPKSYQLLSDLVERNKNIFGDRDLSRTQKRKREDRGGDGGAGR